MKRNVRRNIVKSAATVAALLLLLRPALDAGIVQVASPGGKIRVAVSVADRIFYMVFVGGERVVSASPVSMTIDDGVVLGKNPRLVKVDRRRGDAVITPPVREKRAVIPDRFNEMTLRFRGGFGLVFRAYDDAAAYRFFVEKKGPIKVNDEEATFFFCGEVSAWIPFAKSMRTSFESNYTRLPVKDVGPERLAFAPVLVDFPNIAKVAVTEADIDDYPGMFLTGNGDGFPLLRGKFAPYPLEERFLDKNGRALGVDRAADFIALTRGPRAFPWRVLAVAERDGGLIENDVVYRLGPALRLKDTSWIKPGKVAWDWWNALNLYGVDFAAGINTATYKHYIDFAAKHGLEYIILDEGWSAIDDLFKLNPDIDLPAILSYASSKGVGVILWCVWATLDRQMDEALDRFAAWGVKGIKVDFMDRDDQRVVAFYRRCAEAAAARRLLVNFHGAFKPDGLRRAFPNVLTREGVLGLEHSKWSANVTPEHDLLIPFIRMLAGPMDYTPGAMTNAAEKQFRPVFDRPMSQGTKAHQLAMYVVYESPLQMLCDSPSNYEREPDAMAFLSKVPTVWDETRVLEARVGDYVVVARRSGKDWYIGAMTDWTPRRLEVALDFLDERPYEAEFFSDGPNAARHPGDLKRQSARLNKGDRLTIAMAPGGGFAARLK
ncbi:MAG: glycoside hydrolase family 97 protein [Candidatus Aminicenantes bacterium]|nr:glycoside hydrolase family 97 protein [Candidatus Aminicenantes bacterium]